MTSALLPILLIVPLFDILSYIGLMPWIIKWVGRGLSAVTRQPRFESFFAVEMMFLGNTEALAISKAQLQAISARRNATVDHEHELRVSGARGRLRPARSR